ncbi:MAG: TonB-dependent receptor plug domain-containing protein, partial [Bacteroidales bacterium]|nr:TonB-dependent receptor plug domain-containing protein [Bacteroidales bacterium]
MMKTVKLLFLLLISLSSFSQSYELKGIVFDSESREKLGDVHIQLINIDLNIHYNSISKLNGEFKISGIDKGEYKISTSYLGYKKYEDVIILNSNTELELQLEKELIPLGEVVVSTMRQNQKIKELPAPIEIVDQKQIELSSSFTASDVLAQESGVALSRDGVWATGINIRGLGQQRIVMLVDGNRIETATDLMASMSFFDVDDIEQIEVVKGASSSLYGTGAMGGIVNVITRDGYFNSSPYFNGSLNSGFSSVNELFTRKLTFKSGSERWYASVSGSMRNANDLNTPEGTLENSQFEDKSISATAGFKVKENHILKLKYQYFDD